ncbi:MAG: gliding motility-associated C-terminal domain-containing protein [Lewinellaceae bacterium]|nr:gliding motility-associated C-terminal domain-containing protein [Saprospiraceae bacterium]MCB9331920.1 gliding motility-associated C-terminal domain-containing protein [Lewinellaceae bacterium]
MRFFSLFMLLGLSTAISAQNINEKLVAYFPFTECKGTDESGNGSSGALIDDASCVCGVRDSAIYFDGDADAIFFVGPISDVFTTSDFSVSFYFKPAPVPANYGGSQVLMSKQENCNTNRAFWVRFNPKSKKISAALSQNDTLLANVTANLSPRSCWQYITLTRSNTLFSIYVNGKLADSQTSKARIDLTSNAVFKVGEPICSLDRSYWGDIDELRIYSKALNQDDINALNLRADQIITGDTLVYLGNSLQIQSTPSCTDQFLWTPSAGVSDDMNPEPIITPTVTTTYKLEFSYPGCTASDTIRIKVIDPDTLDCNIIFIPNAFTPSASPGRNDVFGISNPYSVDEFISFEVFDRWGGRVFNAPTVFDTWDGTFQGDALNAGVFLYRLRYRCEGVERVKAGSLTLLR